MLIVALAWMYVVLMMAVAEAMAPQGTVIGAIFTLLLYGVLPLGIVLYILSTPARKRARRAREQRELPPSGATPTAADPLAGSPPPDGSSHAAGAAVAPERKEG